MELNVDSRAESGFPKGTLVPKLRPTALPFNTPPQEQLNE